MELSHIEEHDHEHFKNMVPRGVEQAYADKAYRSMEHDEYLKERGIRNCVLNRVGGDKSWLNDKWSKIRYGPSEMSDWGHDEYFEALVYQWDGWGTTDSPEQDLGIDLRHRF